MRIINHCFGLFCRLSIAVVTVTGAVAQEYRDGVVAVVNDAVITVYDVGVFNAELEREIEFRVRDPQERREQITASRVKAAHRLIEQELIYAEFVRRGYQLPTDLIEKRLDRMVEQTTGGDWQKFEEVLEADGRSMNDYRTMLERRLAVDLLLNQEVHRKIEISPSEIEAYYRENSDEFIKPAQVNMQMLVIKNPDDALVEAVAAATMGATDFLSVADQFSGDVNARDVWIKESEISAVIRDGLTNIATGEQTPPLTIGNDVYLVRIAEVKAATATALDDNISDAIRRNLHENQRRQRYERFLRQLRDQAYVRIFFKE